MLPNSVYVENTDDLIVLGLEDKKENTKTFGLNLTRNVVSGKIDGLAALQQRIYLMLSVEADQYIIYPWTYGLITIDLIGKPAYYVVAVIPDRIKETLLSDDEILDVSDFEFNVNGNKLAVKFVVKTIYGDLEQETVVTY